MRHTKKRYQLNRVGSWRKATVISLAKSLLRYEQIRTTLTRAKAVRPVVESLIAEAKANSLANKRRAFAVLGEHALVNTLFNEIAPRFKDTNGGFTRILKLGQRRGDHAELALFELTKRKEIKAKPKKAEKEPARAAEAEAAPEKAPEKKVAVKEKVAPQKPQKKFFGGIRKIFKKERDSL